MILIILVLILICGCNETDVNIQTNDYKITKPYSEILTLTGESKGWYYYYTNTVEDKAEILKWKREPNTLTFMSYINIKNLSDDPIKLEDVNMKLIVNDTREIEGKMFVENEGQKDKEGNVIRSSVGKDLLKDKETKYSTLIDIPEKLANSNDKLELVISIKGNIHKFEIRDNIVMIKG